MRVKSIIIFLFALFKVIDAQNFNDLFFGDDFSLDIATWNIEWFPKNDETTVEYVIDIINSNPYLYINSSNLVDNHTNQIY